MLFGEYIRSKGYTSKRLADEVGISVRTMEAYANGRLSLKNCRAWLIFALAKALDTTPEYLMTLDD